MAKPTGMNILPYSEKIVLNEDGENRHKHRLGADVYDATQFTPGKEYQTIGLTYHIYDDGSRELVYLVSNDNAVVVPVTTKYFRVV